MNLIPFENIQISSPLKKEEILRRIAGQLQHTTQFGNAFHKDSLKKYEGFVTSNEFKFRRILKSGMNSFIPIIHGKIETESTKSSIFIKIRLHPFVYIMTTFLTLFGLFVFFLNPSLIGLLFPFVPYALSLVFYNIESKMAKDDLIQF